MGRLSAETEGENDKHREQYSGGHARERVREEGERGGGKYIFPRSFGPSQNCLLPSST